MALELVQTVIDTTDARAAAEFYRQLLGWDYRSGDEPPAEGDGSPAPDWLCLLRPDGGRGLAFQLVDTLPVSTWPDPLVPQQLHLDFRVGSADELRAEHARVLALGARLLLDRFDDADEPLYAYADLDGHPFCIFVAP